MKGQASFIPTISEAVFAMMLTVAILNGVVFDTTEFVKEQTVGLNAERIDNAVKALGASPKGYIELKMEGYEFRYTGDKIGLKYKDETAERQLSAREKYSSVHGPPDFTEVESKLCIRKQGSAENPELSFTVGEC